MAAEDPSIKSIVAMTRCSRFVDLMISGIEVTCDEASAQDPAACEVYTKYVRCLKDPTLYFHCSGGARVQKIVPGYRPEDVHNLGHAVLIQYQLEGKPRHVLELDIVDQVPSVVKLENTSTADTRFKGLAAEICTEILSYNQSTTVVDSLTSSCIPLDSPLMNSIDSLHSSDPIAIVGLAMKLPSAIESLSSLLNVLQNKTCLSRKVPSERWDVDSLDFPSLLGESSTGSRAKCVQYGCFIDNLDRFDHKFFGLTISEAKEMDPNQRLVLEITTKALHDSGFCKASLEGRHTGVFVGMSNSDYQDVPGCGFKGSKSVYGATGGAMSVVAGRVSYLLGLHGPSMVIDTACSSALVALHQACSAIRNGECDEAVVAGVNLMLAPFVSVAYARAGMTSPDGKCHTFDESANGYCRGEGCGAIVMKRLSDAVRDGDRIYAVVKGSAVLQDGKSASLTAPNGQAQEALMRAALSDAGISAGDVSYLEAHGTGTPLGDPVETGAIAAVYGLGRAQDNPLYVASVKANIGHLEAAAGMAGLFSAIVALQHGQAPPNAHLKELNGKIAATVEGLAIRFPTSVTPLTRQGSRRLVAGVSSFGYSGTIAHVLLEEAPDHLRRVLQVQSPVIPTTTFKLQANKTAHRLLQECRRESFSDLVVFTTRLHGAILREWLSDHVVHGRVVVPGAALVELMYAAAAAVEDNRAMASMSLEGFAVLQAIVLSDHVVTLSCVIRGGDSVEIFSDSTDHPRALHARARIIRSSVREVGSTLKRDTLVWSKLSSAGDVRSLYDAFKTSGIAYGPSFQLMKGFQVAPDNQSCICDLTISGAETSRDRERLVSAYHVSPPLLDALIQCTGVLSLLHSKDNQHLTAFVPFAVDQVVVAHHQLLLLNQVGASCTAWVKCILSSADTAVYNCTMFCNGQEVLRLEALHMRAIRPADLGPIEAAHDSDTTLELISEWELSLPISSVHTTSLECILVGNPALMRDGRIKAGLPTRIHSSE
eukprot:gene30701-37955_t